MTLAFTLLTMVVLGLVSAVAIGRLGGGLEPPVSSLPSQGLPEGEVTDADIQQIRFAPALRGYRMDEVDAVVDRLADELRRRDAELEQLRRAADPYSTPAAGTGLFTPPYPTTEQYPATEPYPATEHYPASGQQPVTQPYPATEHYPAALQYPPVQDFRAPVTQPQVQDYPDSPAYGDQPRYADEPQYAEPGYADSAGYSDHPGYSTAPQHVEES